MDIARQMTKDTFRNEIAILINVLVILHPTQIERNYYKKKDPRRTCLYESIKSVSIVIRLQQLPFSCGHVSAAPGLPTYRFCVLP